MFRSENTQSIEVGTSFYRRWYVSDNRNNKILYFECINLECITKLRDKKCIVFNRAKRGFTYPKKIGQNVRKKVLSYFPTFNSYSRVGCDSELAQDLYFQFHIYFSLIKCTCWAFLYYTVNTFDPKKVSVQNWRTIFSF